MPIDIWLAYMGTVLVLMCTPGPSQLLMLSNSMRNGFRRSAFTAAGDLTANLLQMTLASVGLASVVQASRGFFLVVKWAGVAYLVYLGLAMILSRATGALPSSKAKRSARSLYWQGFVTSAANPKAVIFFAALFPQFIDPAKPLWGQFVVLSATYLITDAVFLSGYGKFAEWIGRRMLGSTRKYLNRIAGTFLIGAAILLGLKEVQSK